MGDLETTKAMMIELAMRYAADAVKKVSLKSERNDMIKARAAAVSSSSAAASSVKKRPAAAAVVEPRSRILLRKVFSRSSIRSSRAVRGAHVKGCEGKGIGHGFCD